MFCYYGKFERHSSKDERSNPVFVRVVLIAPLDCAIDLYSTVTEQYHQGLVSWVYPHQNLIVVVLCRNGGYHVRIL